MSIVLKPAERRAIKDWEAFRQSILSNTSVDRNETAEEQRARVRKLADNPEQAFAYYFPHYAGAEPADFHKRATRRLFANKRWYEVRAWSRELAKSARSMFEIILLSLRGEITNMLLVSNSYDNAERLLKPYKLEFENNQRLIYDYGILKKQGSWEDGEFVTTNGCSFRALGAGQNPRGARNQAARVDFILSDDIDTDEECKNPDRVKAKWEWFERALIPTLSVSGNYRILINGNIIANDCIVKRAIAFARKTDIVNIRDKNGYSTWPAKNSEADIDSFLANLSTATIQGEFYNNPVSEGEIFKEITWGKVPPLNQFKFLISYADPSPSNNTKSRTNSMKAVFLMGWKDNKLYVIVGRLGRPTLAEFAGWLYDVAEYAGDKTVVYTFVENNSLQKTFFELVIAPLITKEGEQRGTVINISTDERPKLDKYSRIEANLEPLVRAERLIFNEGERSSPHMIQLEEQFKLFTPRLTAPADGPDCIEGGYRMARLKTQQLTTADVYVPPRRRNTKRI